MLHHGRPLNPGEEPHEPSAPGVPSLGCCICRLHGDLPHAGDADPDTCTGLDLHGSVTNEGDGTARNAAIRFMLIDDEASMIRATETVFVPRFPAGETKAFTVDALPGECDRQYHAEIEATCDIP